MPTAVSTDAPTDRTVEEEVRDVLAHGPATSLEIAVAVEERRPGTLKSREGHLLPLLLDLRRRGVVAAAWTDLERGRRRVYSLVAAGAGVAGKGALTVPTEPAPADDAGATSDAVVPQSEPMSPVAAAPDAPLDAVTPDPAAARGDDGADPDPARRPFPAPASPVGAAPHDDPARSAAFRRAAERATRAVEFAPRLAEDLRAEVIHHLTDAADRIAALQSSAPEPSPGATDGASRTTGGGESEEPESGALARFGDPWRIGADLARVARGRRAVPFPADLRESLHAVLLYDAPILAAILAAIAFLRVEVIGAYHIPTKSMEPTLHGDRRDGDRILVLKWAPPPRRFDLAVFDGWPPQRQATVKRCVGLPNEDVKIFEGDLWIDGVLVRKEGAAYEDLLFPVFDLDVERDRADAPGADDLQTRLPERWKAEGGAQWLVDATGAFEGRVTRASAEPATLRWGETVDDTLLDRRTLEEIESGYVDIADLRVAADVTPLGPDARIAARLGRGAQTFDAVLRGDAPGVAIVVDGREVARRDDVELPIGSPTAVRFAQVDHVLRLEVGGALVLRHDLPAPSPPKRTGPSGSVEFRVEAGAVRVRPLRLERDVHWTTEWEPIDRSRLGADEYFMLGDNSANSQDSRSKGAVHGNRLIGRPVLIVWPPARMQVPK